VSLNSSHGFINDTIVLERIRGEMFHKVDHMDSLFIQGAMALYTAWTNFGFCHRDISENVMLVPCEPTVLECQGPGQSYRGVH
jgi:hypothetical protein